MASSSIRSPASAWSVSQNKTFERALAKYGQDTPDRWQKVANAVGDKTADEVKRHYDVLIQDLKFIEAGQVPFPKYNSNGCAKR